MPRRTANAPTVPWDPFSGRRLADARALQGHDQSRCVERLVELGARPVSQSTLCKWERGAVRSLDEETARAISRYGEESGLDIATQLERALTNEPMLSERQTRLVDGLATRLMQDPMTDAEVRLAQTLLRSVGLGV